MARLAPWAADGGGCRGGRALSVALLRRRRLQGTAHRTVRRLHAGRRRGRTTRRQTGCMAEVAGAPLHRGLQTAVRRRHGRSAYVWSRRARCLVLAAAASNVSADSTRRVRAWASPCLRARCAPRLPAAATREGARAACHPLPSGPTPKTLFVSLPLASLLPPCTTVRRPLPTHALRPTAWTTSAKRPATAAGAWEHRSAGRGPPRNGLVKRGETRPQAPPGKQKKKKKKERAAAVDEACRAAQPVTPNLPTSAQPASQHSSP